MKTSLFSQSLFALSLSEAIRATADIGYRAMELACTSPHLDYQTMRRDPELTAKEIRQSGLAVSALSLFNNFTDRAQFQTQVGQAKEFISAAPLFRTEIVKVTPGPPGSRAAGEDHWRCLADAINELAPVARKVGVKLAFETYLGQLTDTLDASVRLLEMSPPDCVGLTVDFSNLRFAGEKMPDVISRLQGRICHTHLKNGYIDSAGGWHFQPLDTGLTDYAEVLALLGGAGYQGYLSIECLEDEAQTDPVRTARRDLEILLRYLGAGSEAK